ncbi:MAG: hypothetical protein ACYTGX_13875 [Planctomycetota bacterium]
MPSEIAFPGRVSTDLRAHITASGIRCKCSSSPALSPINSGASGAMALACSTSSSASRDLPVW